MALGGHLDTTAARKLETLLSPVFDNADKVITLKLDELTYISSSGIRCLVMMFKSIHAKGGKLLLHGVQPMVREVIDTTGLSPFLGLS